MCEVFVREVLSERHSAEDVKLKQGYPRAEEYFRTFKCMLVLEAREQVEESEAAESKGSQEFRLGDVLLVGQKRAIYLSGEVYVAASSGVFTLEQLRGRALLDESEAALLKQRVQCTGKNLSNLIRQWFVCYKAPKPALLYEILGCRRKPEPPKLRLNSAGRRTS